MLVSESSSVGSVPFRGEPGMGAERHGLSFWGDHLFQHRGGLFEATEVDAPLVFASQTDPFHGLTVSRFTDGFKWSYVGTARLPFTAGKAAWRKGGAERK
jgi:hypothetical protein